MKKLSMSLLLLAIMILSISVVSATDADVSADLASAPNDVAINAANDGNILADPANNFAKLQEKIDASSDGNFTLDTNYQRDASDTADIIINRDVKITGTTGHDTIDANNLGRIFNVNPGCTLTLIGVKLINGKADEGGAIYIKQDSNLTIDDVTFENNTATAQMGGGGGAIFDFGSRVNITISGSNFINNTANTLRGGGGAICAAKTNSSLIIDHTDFKFNKADNVEGGAIYVENLNSFKLDYCNFINNTASESGAISMNQVILTEFGSEFGVVNINNTNFINNSATSGNSGAISVYAIPICWSNPIAIENSKFINNTATANNGGALNINNANNVNIKESEFINNNAIKGEAIYIRSNAAANIENSIFTNNGEDTDYSIYNYGNLTLSQNTISISNADIVNFGEILSQINIIVLDNETKSINSFEADLYATITDDNHNLINDSSFNFTINSEEVVATYDNALYKAEYTFTEPNLYPVGMSSTKNTNLNVLTGSIRFKANSTVTVNDVDDAVYGNNITVTFTIPTDGNATGVENPVIYDADGQPVTADIKINNTTKTITIAAGLNASTYTLNVTTIPINYDNYLSVNKSATIVIGKADSNVTVPAYTEVAYGGIIVVTVSDLVNASGVDAKLYNGDAEVGAVSVSDNDITVNVLGLNYGTYTLNVTTITDANHANVTKSGIINVTGKGTPNLGVEDIAPITYGDASISIKANYTGNYNITVDNGDVINVDNIVAGEAKTVSIGVLAAGSHTVKVQFKGDDNYNPSNVVSKDLTVKPATATITLTGTTSIIYGQNTTITATTTHAKAITAKLDGNNVPVSGFNVIVAPGAGSHNLTVTTVPENSNYTASSANVTIVVAKATSSVSVPVVSFIYGGSQTVTVTVVNSTGAIHAQLLNSSGRPVTVGNATVKGKQVTVSGLPVGYYTLEVTVDADDNYQSATGDNLVIVNAKSTSNVTVPPVSFVYGESGTVTVKVTGTTGAIHAQLLDTNGTPLTIGKVIVNGKKVTVSNLPVGNYVLNVTADADDRYEGASGNNSVVVSKAPSSVVINNIIDGAYKTVATNVDYTVTNRTTVTFKISNKTGVVVNETAIDQLEAKLFGLNISNYTITIINAENDNYYGDEDSANFTVTKGYVNMAITSKDVVYPNDVVVTVISDVSGNYSLFKGITSPKYIVLEAGVAQEVNFTDMDAGTYEFALVYLETEYYNTGRKAVNVTVDKANVNMAITSNDVVYPEDVVVTVVSDVSGNYSLYHGTTSPIDIVLEAGVAQEVNFSKVDAGTHEFTLAYLETQNYKAANKSVSVNIAKGNVNMTITAKDVIYPNDVVLTLLSDVSGNYSLYKGITAPQYIDLEAGVAKEVKFSKLDVDTYEFTLVYFETQNYKTSMESVNVDVSKGNVTINISASDVTYPDDIILNLLSDVSGTYDLYLGSVAPFKINLEAGVVKTLECAEFEAGTHEFTLAYLGSTNYNPARESINVTVSKGNVNMNITAKDVTYPDDVVLTLLSDVSGNYSLFKGITSPQDIVLESGVAKEVKFSDLNAGTYEFALVYLETENYTTGRTAINVTVNKVENTTMSINVTTPVATENATVTVTLPADATGNVSVKYGNGVYFADVVNGTAIVSVPTTVAGTETADVIYSGDNNYGSVSSEVNITVKVQGVIIAENIKRGVNSSYDYYATLVNAEGQPISDVEITFTIEGKTYKAKTNASGIATVSAGLVVKDGKDTVYNVTVTNPYTFENTTATTTIVPRLIVVSGDLTADYLENPPYIVQAIGDDGEHVGANVTVRIVFAGFYYDLQTNATGHVVRTIALAPGSYAVRGEYLGYKTEQTPFQVLQILQASSGTLKKKTAKTYTLKATLKHSNGKAIANAEVKLNFNGKNYKVKTNSKGVASYTLKSSQISKLQAGKTYILKALYINDWTKGKWQGKIKVVNK